MRCCPCDPGCQKKILCQERQRTKNSWYHLGLSRAHTRDLNGYKTYPVRCIGRARQCLLLFRHAARKGIQTRRLYRLAPPGSSLKRQSAPYLASSSRCGIQLRENVTQPRRFVKRKNCFGQRRGGSDAASRIFLLPPLAGHDIIERNNKSV